MMRYATLALAVLLTSCALAQDPDTTPDRPELAPAAAAPVWLFNFDHLVDRLDMYSTSHAEAAQLSAPFAMPADATPAVAAESEQSKAQAPIAVSVQTPPVVSPDAQKIVLKIDDPLDASGLAYDLTMSWINSEEWQRRVVAMRKHFNDWEESNGGDGDMGRYLNDRLIVIALGAATGKVDSLKNGFVWLAYYKEFNQQVPAIVSNVMRDHQASLLKLFNDFSWERASQYVRNKEWRGDIVKK